MRKIPILIMIVLTLVAASRVQATIVEFHNDWIIHESDEYDMVYVYNDATLGITGGKVLHYIYANESSTVNFFDGMIANLFAHDTSTVNMYGGSTYDFCIRDSSVASLFGGEIVSDLIISDSGKVYIYGYEFNWRRAGGISESGWLTGYWLDGTPFTIYLRNLPEPFPGSHIYLIPEPCTFLLLSLGGLILRRQKFSR